MGIDRNEKMTLIFTFILGWFFGLFIPVYKQLIDILLDRLRGSAGAERATATERRFK